MTLSEKLTEQELDVLWLCAEGLSDREIGDRLHYSPETVKTFGKRLRLRLGARNRTHAVALGFRLGLLA